jgi:translation initiation factor 6
MIGKTHYYGNPFIGIFAKANDSFAFVPKGCSPGFLAAIREHLGVETIETMINGSNLIGIYMAVSKDFVFLPEIAGKEELEEIRQSGLEVIVTGERHNAWGNNLSINSRGGVINKDISPNVIKYLEDITGAEIVPMEIENYNTMGSVVLATEKGFAVKNNATEEEIKNIESILRVKGGIATANMGNVFISACALANSKGLVVGESTTGIELARLQDSLNLL